MSAIFGETLTFTQATGEPIRLVVFGDDMFARYETVDGFTVVYDEDVGRFCYANTTARGIASSGVPADEPPPQRLARHQHASRQLRNERVRDHLDGMLPVESSSREREALLTFGPSGGLLPGRVLNNGSVRGLTILITFPDTPSTVTTADVTSLLNGPNYRANGNASSVAEYFETMSTGRLHFTNDVVGPFQMSRPKLAYANVDGLLVPEALQLAIDHGVDFSRYDSLGQGIVDAVCIMYAGRTEYRGDLWPHNWVHRKTSHGVRTELYIVTSMGRRAQDLSIGTFCHESGHLLFRWPDLYDYGLAEREGDDFKSSGIGTYCLMAAGNHLDQGRTPAPVSAYLRDLVGWCGNQVDLNTGGRFEARHGGLRHRPAVLHRRRERVLPGREPQRARVRHPLHVERPGGLPLRHPRLERVPAGHPRAALPVRAAPGRRAPRPRAGAEPGRHGRPVRRDDRYCGLARHRSRLAALGRLRRRADPLEHRGTRRGDRLPAGAGRGGRAGGHRLVVPGLVIPENRPEGVGDVIMLAGEGTVRSLRVTVSIAHTYIGDLRVALLSPTGKRAVLHNRSGGSRDNLELDLTSEPPSLLAPLVGQPVAGAWRLSVSDNAAVDTGTLTSWSLEIHTGT